MVADELCDKTGGEMNDDDDNDEDDDDDDEDNIEGNRASDCRQSLSRGRR